MKTTRRTLLRWSVAGCAALVAVSAGVTCAQTQVVTADRISMAEFKKLHASGSVLVVDVRDADSFKLGHIPGAILVPLEQVSARARELKAVKKPIVTYCAWPEEQTSARAALDLRAKGIKDVKALAGGWHTWVQDGGQIEK